jgi:hypothetical protein
MVRSVTDLPGEPLDHMNALLKLILPFAREQIEQEGGFFPFGASMAPDGEVALVATSEENASPERYLHLLRQGAHDQADRHLIMAIGICSDMTTDAGPRHGAIRVELEHRDAEPVTCLLPYGRLDDQLRFGELERSPGERRTWR